ncbi:hypothetical protein BJV78DRAFT_95391 [Lactifluus subvellereus]|nr:hypothetical protein BJV78DRAFT_95391 [Lactifluus subvellereus]
MESPVNPLAEELEHVLQLYLQTLSPILYYDYVLTLPREIQFLWPPHNKLGWFTLACLLNRYLPVFGYLPVVLSYIQFAPRGSPLDQVQPCLVLEVYNGIIVAVLQVLAGNSDIPHGALCLIRVYALYGHSCRVLGLLLVVGSGSIINATCVLFRSGFRMIATFSRYGCQDFTSSPGGLYDASAWTGVLIFDSVIFSLTLYKAVTFGRDIPLLDVIVRDGAMYFSVLFIVNAVNILTLRFSPPFLKHCTATLTNVLSTTLVSRLVLNLREQNTALAGLSTTVESEWKFRAALPVAGTMTPSWDITSVQVDKSTSGITPNDVVGGSC